jgi:AcrR family transcriptional regulator
MAAEKRPYQKKRRAELEEQTRRRITEATVELHGSLGPARTSVSAVAARAGVRRSTVYRHFPDEAALFAACSSHWMAANQPPDLTAWAAVEDPEHRLSRALCELYAYYRGTEAMLANLHRDEATMPIVKELFARFHEFVSNARDTLMLGRGASGDDRRREQAAIGHALAFTTWRSLTREQGLDDDEAADLMAGLMAVGPRRVTTRSH